MLKWVFIALMLGATGIAQAGIYDIDGDGETRPLTDGLLVLRHQFGFTGQALTGGAIGSGAIRTEPTDISLYLSNNPSALDIDGDGEGNALVDGLLLMRYLFGFSGEPLTQGAISTRSVRNNYEQIKAFIETGETTGTANPISDTNEVLRFVYQTECTNDIQGNQVCFSESEAGFKDVEVGASEGASGWAGSFKVSSSYGTIKVQSLVEQWPDGEVFVDDQGQKSYSINTYDGYQQNRVPDDLNFNQLTDKERAARWGAQAVVQVIADRCLLNQNGSKDWRFSSLPRTGYFIGPDLVLTDARSIVNLEEDPTGGGSFEGGVFPSPEPPHDPMSCQGLVDFFFPGVEGISIEVGKGPFIQTFEGNWAAGEIVANDEHFALIRLTKGTTDKDQLLSQWQDWQALQQDDQPSLQLRPEDLSPPIDLIALHNPTDGREAGGWHTTTGKMIVGCEEDFYLEGYAPNATDLFAIDLWSDGGGVGAPLIDAQGFVSGMIRSEYPDIPDECYGEVNTSKNTLGVLSTFFADPKKSTVAIGNKDIRSFIATYDSNHPSIQNTQEFEVTDNEVWPVSGVTLATTAYEVIDYGDTFLESGFPLSEVNSAAFDVAKQATVMFIKQNGCTTCEADTKTNDFSDTCLCTGFAVSEHLIVTNDHCVTSLFPGDETTFKTFQGQIVNATLVDRSGLNTGDIYKALIADPEWENSGGHNGDVALLRTDQIMDLIPVQFGNPSNLVRRDPLITVGHPAIMLRSGPYVTSGGSFIGKNVDEQSTLHYTLPASGGASGSGVFDLDGRLVGQIAFGSNGYRAAEETWLKSEFGKEALEIAPSDVFFDLQPRPFLLNPRVQIGLGRSTSGASSDYIRDLVNYWAPGELP